MTHNSNIIATKRVRVREELRKREGDGGGGHSGIA